MLILALQVIAAIGFVALVIVVGIAWTSKSILLLTIASGLSLIVLLLAVAAVLVRIIFALDNVERNLGKIAMGVRAIDTQTHPLQPSIEGVNNSFVSIRDGLKKVHSLLDSASQKL